MAWHAPCLPFLLQAQQDQLLRTAGQLQVRSHDADGTGCVSQDLSPGQRIGVGEAFGGEVGQAFP